MKGTAIGGNMYIKKIEFSNFQCFGKDPVCLEADKHITCLLGNNGSGKSTVIKALQRLFGRTAEERKIVKSDFHICTNETDEDLQGRQLYLDIWFGFNEEEGFEDKGVAFFSSQIFQDENKKNYVRMRLEASWSEGEYEDEVSSNLYWVLTGNDIEFGSDSPLKVKVENYERRQIDLFVIPAVRNANNILKSEFKQIIKKLERYTKLTDEEKEFIDTYCKTLEKVNSMQAIQSVEQIINDVWEKVHNSSLKCYQNVKLEVIASKFEGIIKSLLLKLAPAETAPSKELTELSDGQISILYFSLSMALLDLELSHNKNNLTGFKEADYDLPVFTIVALEEPENHLSPFYLSRILSVLAERSNSGMLSTIITSHSPNVVRRMKQIEQIRFLRQQSSDTDRNSVINGIILPEDKTSDDYKYIKQAVLSHPELYFAKLVVLGEGDSEEIVLPTIAQKFGYDFDASFVSFVPLGGRHVNHMWRLLKELEIPYLTLLDYDLGRESGGRQRLEEISKKQLKKDSELSIKELQKNYNVFFSYPLDLDMLMILSFSEFYLSKGKRSEHDELVKAVLGKNGNEQDYLDEDINFFSDKILKKYRYLFKTKSKVASHYLGCENISAMDDDAFLEKCPFVLFSFVKRIRELLNMKASEMEEKYSQKCCNKSFQDDELDI